MDGRIEQAAQILAEARRKRDQIGALPEALAPKTMAEAHAMQDVVAKLLGETVRGWKINAPPGQDANRGALLGSTVMESPARYPASKLHRFILEGEVAFRFDRDMPARGKPYEEEEVLAAVTAFPAIEFVDYRFADPRSVPALDKVADHSSNGGFVMGKPVSDWRRLDIKNLHVTLKVDGKVTWDKTIGHPLGNPFIPLIAMPTVMSQAGGIKAGQVVTTGTCTGMTYMEPGQHAEVIFEGLGSVEVTLVK